MFVVREGFYGPPMVLRVKFRWTGEEDMANVGLYLIFCVHYYHGTSDMRPNHALRMR